MTTNQNIRKALKAVEKLSQQMETGMGMDLAMDGSGECGGMITEGWTKWFNGQIQKVLAENGVTLTELEKNSLAWGEKELEMGPDIVHISFDDKHYIQKQKDIFDTRWGSLAFTLTQSINC